MGQEPGTSVAISQSLVMYGSTPSCHPRLRRLSCQQMGIGDRAQPLGNDWGVDETGVKQGCDEVLVRLPECAELRNAKVLLVEAPSGELR